MAQETLFLTVGQATQRLKDHGMVVHRDTVQRWCRTGRLPAVAPGNGYYRIRVEDIDALLRPRSAAA